MSEAVTMSDSFTAEEEAAPQMLISSPVEPSTIMEVFEKEEDEDDEEGSYNSDSAAAIAGYDSSSTSSSSSSSSEEEDDGNSSVDEETNGSEISAEMARLALGRGSMLELDFGSIETVAEWIESGACQRILVLSGAGVSCAAGIPDFRSPGTGLYDNLQQYNLPYPQAVFELEFYRSNPFPFISLAQQIWPGQRYSPTYTHSFIALLQRKNLLLRNYTQNIDGLEILAGIPAEKLVECHGHFRSCKCTSCRAPFPEGLCRESIVQRKQVPTCHCCGGYVKPDIVFFGESLPPRMFECLKNDLEQVDLLLVLGTSLTVAPVSLIPDMVPAGTRRVLMNRELVGKFCHENEGFNDVFYAGDCDESVKKLSDLLGWSKELENLNTSAKIYNSEDAPSNTNTTTDSTH